MEEGITPWTKEQYLAWLKKRPSEPAEWSIDDCHKADRLIEREAMAALRTQIALHVRTPALRQFVEFMAQAHFGSVEVDELLMSLECYPDWMDRGRA